MKGYKVLATMDKQEFNSPFLIVLFMKQYFTCAIVAM